MTSHVRLGSVSIVCLGVMVGFASRPNLALVLCCGIILTTILGATIYNAWQVRSSRTWQLVDAQVESGVVDRHSSKKRTYLLDLSFSYCVNGSTHGSTYQQVFDSESEAIKLFNSLKQYGLKVRVNPKLPECARFYPLLDL